MGRGSEKGKTSCVWLMMRICVAILLMVSVKGEVPEVGINSSPFATTNHDAAPFNGDPVIIPSNPIEHSADRLKTAYGVSSLRNKMNNSKIKLKVIKRRFGGNTIQNKPIIVHEHQNKDISKDKFKGYPNAGTVKTHYQAPVDINVVKTLDSEHDALLIQKNNQRQTIETLIDDYEPLKEEPSAFKEQEDLQIPRSSGVPKFSNINMRESPITEYGTPRTISAIHESKKSLEKTYDTPIPLDSRSSNVASVYDNSKPGENFHRKSKYESDDIYEVPSTKIYDIQKSTYGVSKSLNDKYGVPKLSKTIRNPKSLEKTYGDMHATHVSRHFNNNYEELRNINGAPKSLNNKYSAPKNNYRNSRYNRGFDLKTNNKTVTHTANQYKIPKYDDYYQENSTQFNNVPGYSTEAQANSVKIDQEYDNTNDNYEARSNYYYNDFNDQDFSSYAYENGQVFPNEISDNTDPYDSYGVPESPKPPKTYSVPLKFLASKMSPGIIGVTQAIIRPNYDYEEPPASSKAKFGANHRSNSNNGGRIDQDSYQTGQKTLNEQERSDQNIEYTRSRAKFTNYGTAEKTLEGYEDKFVEYPSRRTVDEEENVPAVYRFEYAVSDEGTDQFGHRESRQHERTHGSYHVILPDGRKQIVDYEADEHGFKPRIRYEDAPLGYDLGPKSGYGFGPKSKSSHNDRRSGDLAQRTRYSDQQTGYD